MNSTDNTGVIYGHKDAEESDDCYGHLILDRKTAGLGARYDVRKINDPTGKHAECRYFVLDPQHDPMAYAALATYAHEARRRHLKALADDIDSWLAEVPAPCPWCPTEVPGRRCWYCRTRGAK